MRFARNRLEFWCSPLGATPILFTGGNTTVTSISNMNLSRLLAAKAIVDTNVGVEHFKPGSLVINWEKPAEKEYARLEGLEERIIGQINRIDDWVWDEDQPYTQGDDPIIVALSLRRQNMAYLDTVQSSLATLSSRMEAVREPCLGGGKSE